MKKRFAFEKYRIWFIIIPVLITIVMLAPLRSARINADLMKYLPGDIEAIENLNRMEENFGHYEPVILFIQSPDVLASSTLQRVRRLNDAFLQSPVFKDAMSIYESKYIRSEDGSMIVDPAIPGIPSTEQEREALRVQIVDNPMVYRLLVSENFQYTLIVLNPEKGRTDKEIFTEIDQVLSKNPGEEPILINGLPYLRDQIQRIAIRDLAILMPLGLIIMMIFLGLSFRERKGVLLPLMVVTMAIALAMGLMPLMGWDLSLIAVLVPILMIAIANNYGVHIITRYQELNAAHPHWTMPRIISEAYERLRMPIILTALTTIVGILGMATHVLLPARQMGIVSAAGIAFALLASLWMIPAIMVNLPKGKPHKSFNGERFTWIDRLLKWAGRISTGKPVAVVLAFAALVLVAAIGILSLHVSFNLEQMMPAKHPIRTSTQIANEHFGGTKRITLLFEGDILDPTVMRSMDEFETKLERMPEVGDVISIASVVRLISRSLNDPGDEYYDKIPDSRDAIAQYIEFYNMSGDPEDFEQLVDFNFSKAVLNIQFKAADIKEFRKVYDKVRELEKATPYITSEAGQCLIEKSVSQSIIKGQVYSLLFALLAIFIMMWIIFKCFKAGVIGSIPLLASLICNFGLMGWLGLELDIATSLLSSISIGIGVDYTIHFFWRLKYELSLGKSRAAAIKHCISTTGRGITINAISVMIGFAVLFFSGLTILKAFALLIIISLLICLLCALVLIPAIMMIQPEMFKPKDNETATIPADFNA